MSPILSSPVYVGRSNALPPTTRAHVARGDSPEWCEGPCDGPIPARPQDLPCSPRSSRRTHGGLRATGVGHHESDRIGARAGSTLVTSSFLPPTFTSNSAAWRSVTAPPFLSMAVTYTVRVLWAAASTIPVELAPVASALTTESNRRGSQISHERDLGTAVLTFSPGDAGKS